MGADRRRGVHIIDVSGESTSRPSLPFWRPGVVRRGRTAGGLPLIIGLVASSHGFGLMTDAQGTVIHDEYCP